MSTAAAAAAAAADGGGGGGAILGRMGAGSATADADVAAILSGTRWNLLQDFLSHEEQLRLFGFVHERDATDWDGLSPCMNPSPKTLQLAPHRGARAAPHLTFRPDDEAAVVEMVQKATRALGWSRTVRSVTVAAIRYCASGSDPRIGGSFPPHVDHCNDGSWVFLFSLGRTATLHIKTPDDALRRSFRMRSGDALVFDPSSEAAVLHGIDVVARGEEDTSPRRNALGETFEMLRRSRFGVQCRVSFVVDPGGGIVADGGGAPVPVPGK